MTPLKPGDDLDRYRLLRLVASGGMASIFQAIDTDTGKVVAIKVPHPDAECSALQFDRFQREREIGQMLDDKCVVKVLPTSEQSRVYMAMEWADGLRLRDVLDSSGKLPAERAVKIAIEICRALAYIHSNGVVHRDLKPENIMLDESDGVKLLDFGIASKAGARRLTFGKLSNVMGTPDYISPEQVRGKRGDARTDIYSLGTILYEMLTGVTPFSSSNPFKVMNDRMRSDATPVRKLEASVDKDLEYVVQRAMARDAKQRYATAQDLARDLMHLEGAADRAAVHESDGQKMSGATIGLYSLLAMIPLLIFVLMLFVARNGG